MVLVHMELVEVEVLVVPVVMVLIHTLVVLVVLVDKFHQHLEIPCPQHL